MASSTTETSHEDGLGGRITIHAEGDGTAPMRFVMVLPRGFGPPAPERHPLQREDFRVLRGTLDLGMVQGARVVLRAGESFRLPAGAFHLPANGGDDELEFEAVLTPGLDSAQMFAALYTVTREHRGLGRFVRQSMVFRRYREVISFPLPVRVAMTVVAALGRLAMVRIGERALPASSSAGG